jgi:hypothetical protein
MSSISGIRDGDFDRLRIVQDLAVGQDQNFGTSGQVLTSAGEGEELFWGTNSATLPQGLVAGTNITFTPAGTYNGSVETTISATDTNTEYTGVVPIVVTQDDEIGLDFGETLTVDGNDNLAVVKVPNTLTITDSAGTSVVYDGSTAKSITINDDNTEYTAGNGIQISGSNVIQTKTDNQTIRDSGGGSGNNLEVIKVPNTLTITDSAGTSVVFDGSASKSITINDNDTTYQADLGVEIDTSTSPDTIKAKVDSSAQPTLRNDLNSNELAVLRVPNNLTCILGLEYSTGTSYDGSAQRILNTKVDSTTIDNQGGTGFDELNVKKVPNTLTITDSAGTSVVYDGSATKSITINDDDTTYQAGTGISIDTTTDPDTINCSNIPNSALANSTISGISLGSNLANLTAGTNISFDVGTTYNGSTAVTISATDTDTGITTLNEGDGINITDVSATEKTISANIDTNTLQFITDTLGAPEPKEISVKKVPNAISFVTDGTGSRTGTFDGSGVITIDNRDSDTTYTATAPIDITSEVISLNKDATLTTITNNLSVVKVPNSLTITDSAGTSVVYDGSAPKSITINDDTLNLIEGNGISIVSSGDDRTISVNADGTTLSNNVGSGQAGVLKVPYQLTAGTGITMSSAYDGSSAVTISSSDATTTETIVVQVNPTTNTSYAVYRKQLTDPRSLTEQFYPIDTNFHYEFTDNPVARYYKVDIQLHLTNGAIALPVLSSEPVFLRIDKDSNGDDAWGIPQVIDYAFRNGTTIHIKQASFIVDFGSDYATLTAPDYPDIHPSMIQQSASAVSPSAGRRATNENALVLYGGTIAPQGLMMVLTPLGDDVSTTTTGNPYSTTGSDGITYDSDNIYQNPYVSILTKVQEASKLFSAGTSYTEYSSDFRVSFIAPSTNVIVEFRAIVRADNRLFYGGLYDWNGSSWITNTRTRFNYNDETDQDFTTITWMMKGLTKGNTYYISPYFRGSSSSIYIYAGHDNAVDGYAPAIMRVIDAGTNVSYVEPADDY